MKLNHLADVCMTYPQHFFLSVSISIKLFIGSLKAFVHAFIPAIFYTSTSVLVNELNNTLKTAGCR